MNKLKFYLTTSILILLFGPFYLIGATVGQFVGALIKGYKDGTKIIKLKVGELLIRAKYPNRQKL